MKKTILAVLLVISLNAFSQVDSSKKDTVVVFERTDTIKASYTYCNSDAVVRYMGTGHLVVKGIAVPNGKGYQWVKEPAIIAILNQSKRQFNGKLIQVLQVIQ